MESSTLLFPHSFFFSLPAESLFASEACDMSAVQRGPKSKVEIKLSEAYLTVCQEGSAGIMTASR